MVTAQNLRHAPKGAWAVTVTWFRSKRNKLIREDATNLPLSIVYRR